MSDTHDATPDPIAPNVRELISLYADALSELAFPDVSLGILEAGAESVRGAHQAVMEARAALASAERALEASRASLFETATLGLSYAEVYARRRPELRERVEAIALTPRTKPKKKSRSKGAKGRRAANAGDEEPKREERSAAELPFGGEAQAMEAEAEDACATPSAHGRGVDGPEGTASRPRIAAIGA